jgi:AcrR family transcriptional regulator
MDNRQILLDRALQLFSQRGYDGVGVQEIVDAAGVTKPTLYHYFVSKRGLLEELLKREEWVLLSELGVAVQYRGDIVLTLENIARAYFKIAEEHSIFYRMQLAMYFAPPESESHQAVLPYARQQNALLEGVFVKAAEDHGNMRNRHRRYAAGLMGMLNGMIGLYLSGQAELTDEVIYQTVHQFMHGIFS